MQLLAILVLAFTQMVNVGGPTQVQDPAYPLHVRILQRSGERRNGAMRVWGRGDIESPKEQGFDYQSDCDVLFMVSHGDEFYSARWKKQDKELEMLVSRMGTGKAEKCTVKADLKPFVYVRGQTTGEIVTKPIAP
jgi:hypothetical protein